MELGNKIKEYRLVLKLTQDDLAEKMYVSRQTISNWENDKSYPDIHSLILFSELVGVSLDQLVKGDIETMERNMSETEAKKLKKYRLVFGILIVLLIGLAIPLYLRLGRYACIPFGILFVATMLFGLRIEEKEKENEIEKYKEIISLSEGKKLDEIVKQRKDAQSPFRKLLICLTILTVTAIACIVVESLVRVFFM